MKSLKKIPAFTKGTTSTILMLICLMAFSLPTRAADYYWVNGTGYWSDYGGHWAISSGGTIFHTTLPTPVDNIYFDVNSFTADSQFVWVDSTFAYCNNMDWSGINFKVKFYTTNWSGSGLTIYGSLILDADLYHFECAINFMGTQSNQIFDPAGVALLRNVTFNSTGTYNLNSDLNCSGVTFYNGIFNSNNFTLDVRGIGTMPYAIPEVNLGNSEIYCENLSVLGNPNFNSSASNLYLYTPDANGGQSHLSCSDTVTFKNIYFTGNWGEILGPVNADTIMFSGNGTIRNYQSTSASINCNYLYFAKDAVMQVNSNNVSELQYVEFLGSIYFTGEATFDTLFLNNIGKEMNLSGILNINDTIIFNGSCSNITSIKNGNFNKTNGIVLFEYVLLEDVHALGGAVFIANNSIDAGGNTGWLLNTPVPRNLYWVEGQGLWNDTTHWSLSSGGPAGNCPPNLSDNVFFDSLSFITNTDSILVPQPEIYCNNFTVAAGINFIPVFKKYDNSIFDFDLNVYGSLIVSSEINLLSDVVLKSNFPGNIIESQQSKFVLTFLGSGEWSLNNDLISYGLYFRGGNFHANSHNIITGPIISNNASPMPNVDFGNSIITCSSFDLSNLGAAFDGQNTTLIFDSTLYNGWQFLKCNNQIFDNIYCSSKMRISGAFTCNELVLGANDSIHSTSANIQKLSLHENSFFSGNLTIDSLIQVVTGKNIEFDAGTILTISSDFQASGFSCAETNRIFADSTANIVKTSGSLNLDFVHLENINASGGAIFNATNAIDGGGNSGWTIASPAARNLFWVGASGNWSDQSHWALTSGGPGGNCIPTILDDVYLDDNSFNPSGFEVIDIDLPEIYFKNLNYNVSYSSMLKQIDVDNNNNINVHGSLIFNYKANIGGNFSNIRPSFVLHSIDSGNTIKTATTQLGNILFTCPGSYSLTDSLSCDSIVLESGMLVTDGFPIKCTILLVTSSAAAVDFGINTLYCDILDCAEAGQGFQSQDLEIVFSPIFNVGNPTNLIRTNNGTFKSITGSLNFIVFYGGFTCESVLLTNSTFFRSLDGNDTIQVAKMVVTNDITTGSGNLYFIIDSLILNNASHTIEFRTGDKLKINAALTTNSTASFPLELTCDQPGNFEIESASGMICLDNMIMQGVHATGGGLFYAGANTIDLGNNAGWIYASCNPANTDVWPGDANYDLTVNNFDVLNVGLGYNAAGPVRPGATNNWVAQPASDWGFQFGNGANLKNADCDGDGIINSADTTAISLNYGLTHPLRLANPGSASLPGPPLYVVATPDTVMEGDTVQVDIYLGTSQIPVDSIYGLAFTLSFDSTLIDTTYMPFDYSGSWMGIQNVDLLTFEKKFLSQGMVDIAITRTDMFNMAGSGIVLTTGVVIIDNIGARLSSAPPFVNLPITISNVRAVTASEYYFSLSYQGDNVEIDTLGTTGLPGIIIADDAVMVYPNPARETVHIYSNVTEIQKLELSDKMGVVRQVSFPGANKSTLDTRSLPAGIYLLEVTTSKGVVVKKVVVTNK